MRIALGSDHAGFLLKSHLLAWLEREGHETIDFGTWNEDSVDYPDFGSMVGQAVAGGQAELGVCCCGTGIGISIAANKVVGVRAAVVHDVTTARLAKEHNNANVICMGGRIVGMQVAEDSLREFVAAEFQSGRHQRRIDKISELEKKV